MNFLSRPTCLGTPLATTAAATQAVAGLMSAADKKKLDESFLPGGTAAQIMLGNGAGSNTIPPAVLGMTYNSTAEIAVQVNPNMWVYVTDGTNYGLKQIKNLPAATQIAAGLLSPTDKKKIDDLPADDGTPIDYGTL